MFLQRLMDEPRFIGSRSAPAGFWGMGCCADCGNGEPDPCGCDGATAKSPGFTFTVPSLTQLGGGCFCDNYENSPCLAYIGSCNWFAIGNETEHVCTDYPTPAWWIQAECSDDQPCSANLFFNYWTDVFGPVGFRSYTCDSFSCTTGGTFTRVGPPADDFTCDDWPDEIEVTPSEECTFEPAEDCPCTPKSAYSPVVSISGITDGSCESCSCIPNLALCFEPYGEDDDDCQWIATISLPSGDPIACATTASYAILNTFDSGHVTVRFYDSSDVQVALYQAPLSAFDCDAAGVALEHISSSDTCAWPTDFGTAFLTMHGTDPCPTCSPCVPSAMIAGPLVIRVDLQYDAHNYTICVLSTDGCTAEGSLLILGGDTLRVVVEFGTVPASYARLLVYLDPFGGDPEVLIGVYNYLDPLGTFQCSGGLNGLHLATGNPGECGADVDVEGYTELLSSGASIAGLQECYVCEGDDLPDTMTATWVDNNGLRCCDNAITATLTRSGSTWTGTLSCPGTGETIDVAVSQTGVDCTDFRIAVTPDSCDPGVANIAPYACTCGELKFRVTGEVGIIPQDEVWVTW